MSSWSIASWSTVTSCALLCVAACGGDNKSQPAVDAGGAGADGAADAGPNDGAIPDAPLTADWVIALDPTAPAGKINPALLGQYDLSGALFRFDQVQGLAAAMKAIGFSDWRVGVGRWEGNTLVLPGLTNMPSACTAQIQRLPPAALAPSGSTDLDLISARDWFIDDGQPVTEAMTLDDNRYKLDYVRSVLDTVATFGANAFVNIDHMPRALAVNRTPFRGGTPSGLDACEWSWTNRVSNVRPASYDVFAAAAVGLVKRVVEGSGGQAARAAPYWEIWNEPDLDYAWDPMFETNTTTREAYFTMAATALVKLDAYRTASIKPEVKALRFGLGSFAETQTVNVAFQLFDTTVLPGGGHVPVDFVSFHSYSNDPLRIVADIQTAVDARKGSTNYKNVELALAEWGPDLGMPPLDTTMDPSLIVMTALALGANIGLDRAHRSIFYDYYAGLPYGVLDNAVKPVALYRAYALLYRLIGAGTNRLPARGFDNGQLDQGKAAVLASRESNGKVRVLFVNRNTTSKAARVDIAGAPATPTTISSLDNPSQPPRALPPASVFEIPARSVVLAEF